MAHESTASFGARTLSSVLLVAGLASVSTACGPSRAALDARDQAMNVHRERTEPRRVARDLFENPRAVSAACGRDTLASHACTGQLYDAFFRRLELAYTLSNWAEIAMVCDAYPGRCATARQLEAVVEASQEKAAVALLRVNLAQIDLEESFSSRSKPRTRKPEPRVEPLAALAATSAAHERKAPFLDRLRRLLWSAEDAENACVGIDESSGEVTRVCAAAPTENAPLVERR